MLAIQLVFSFYNPSMYGWSMDYYHIHSAMEIMTEYVNSSQKRRFLLLMPMAKTCFLPYRIKWDLCCRCVVALEPVRASQESR